MSAMANTSGGFRATLLTGWSLLCVVGLVYARWKGIPSWAALPSLAAFLIVYPFYLVPAFPRVREQLAGAPLPGFLIACAVLPYLAVCSGAIQFQFVSFVKLIALALALGLWYRVLPATPLVDVGFLVLVVAVKIGGYATPIYPTPFKGVEIARLGDLALFNIVVLVLMLERRIRETGYGFLPTRNDWRIGARNYLYFLPIGVSLGFLLKAGHLVKPSDPLKLTALLPGLPVCADARRGVHLPRRAPAVDRRLDLEPAHRADPHLDPLRRGAPLVPPLSQLAMGDHRRYARLVLRPRAQSGRQHTRRHGDPHPGDHDVAGLLRRLTIREFSRLSLAPPISYNPISWQN